MWGITFAVFFTCSILATTVTILVLPTIPDVFHLSITVRASGAISVSAVIVTIATVIFPW